MTPPQISPAGDGGPRPPPAAASRRGRDAVRSVGGRGGRPGQPQGEPLVPWRLWATLTVRRPWRRLAGPSWGRETPG
ncbi:hypothetical protein E2C01_040220 [Portunus trituberculatus]|uniref:Uncharacterized protein n=1 Tax=Portunus trituberculatus TaxID=210409 RepID=A0A5B7FGT8_PORTR|nr:hypothetical protein [Portunus trituberculatus]